MGHHAKTLPFAGQGQCEFLAFGDYSEVRPVEHAMFCVSNQKRYSQADRHVFKSALLTLTTKTPSVASLL